MNNASSISSVKTVAGENTTENLNEQMETAQVINDNKTIAMNTAKSQSSMAPQVGANETAQGSRVEETVTVSEKESAIDAAQVINQENNSKNTKETNSQDAIELEVEMCETSSLNAKDTATENTLGEVKGRDAYDYACLGSLYDGSFFEVELFKSPEWWNNIDNED